MRKDISTNINLGELKMVASTPSFLAPLLLFTIDTDDLYYELRPDINFNIGMLERGEIGFIMKYSPSLKNIHIRMNYNTNVEPLPEKVLLSPEDENMSSVDLFAMSDGFYDGYNIFAGINNPLESYNKNDKFIAFRIHKINDGDDFKYIATPIGNYDLEINRALEQNKYFLLVAAPSQILEYPINGVGILNYLNSDVISARLGDKIREEFSLDKMVVDSASFDEETFDMELFVTERDDLITPQ